VISAEDEQNPQIQQQSSSITYLIIGATVGSLGSILLVAYVNKQQGKLKKKNKSLGLSTSRSNLLPSSGSPLSIHTSIDDEKSA